MGCDIRRRPRERERPARRSRNFSQRDRCRNIHHPLRHQHSMPVLYRSSGAMFALSRPLTHRRGTQRLDAGRSIAACDRSSILSLISGNVAVGRRGDKPPKQTSSYKSEARHIANREHSLANSSVAASRPRPFAYFYSLCARFEALPVGVQGTGERFGPFSATAIFCDCFARLVEAFP